MSPQAKTAAARPASGLQPGDGDLLNRIAEGLRLVTAPLPQFAGLSRLVRVTLDDRVPTMGVFPSGRLAVNREFLRSLGQGELVFVLAHELFHLALRTHDRAAGADPLQFNYAHDYIINDILRHELNVKVPAGGLDWPGARLKSAEEILLEMEKHPDKIPARSSVWNGKPISLRGLSAGNRGGRPRQAESDVSDLRGDVLDGDREREMFPDEDDRARQAREEELRETTARALSMGQLIDALRGPGRGRDAGASSQVVSALRGLYRTPWEMALQRWLDAVAPGQRTFLRASRRGAERSDLVLPGRKREGWILNIVLDTSGSMTDEIPRALGAIADFCEAVSVDQIRLVQCDTAVTSDMFLQPSEVARHQISGFGGSDLSPALRHLADDPRVEAAIVLTDGEIAYPPERMPYDVLWVLSSHGSPTFQPPYGQVIRMLPS